jgi:glyceraldehyde-3-phosphate dehydrogenase/erythrose-4-phosphate dehydrogenase
MKQKIFGKIKNRSMNVPQMLRSLHYIYCNIKSDPMMSDVAEHVLHAEELLRGMRDLAAAVAEEAGSSNGFLTQGTNAFSSDEDRCPLDETATHHCDRSRFRLH